MRRTECGIRILWRWILFLSTDYLKRMEKIRVRKNRRRELQDAFPGVSMSTISRALNFRSFSDVARQIRQYAVNHLGGRAQ